MKILQTLSTDRRILILVFMSILAVYGLSYYKRMSSYAFWMNNSQDYVVDHVTAMSDRDAYYWLRMARELDAGHLGRGLADSTKGYPDLVPLAIKDRPSLLAEFISFGKNFTDGDYYRSGLLLIPILAGLFVFPLFFYFNRLGFGASAVLGGLVGSFCHAYYDRTMMGRLDTDLLNTFFPLAAATFILPIKRENSLLANTGWAVGAGMTLYFFTRWYQQPSFILVYGFVLLLYLLFQRLRFKHFLPVLLAFLVMSGPEYVMQSMESLRTFSRAYVSPPPTGLIAWPDILKAVAEAQGRGLMTSLKMLHGFLPVVIAGFAGLAYLCIRHFRQMIPIAPLLLFGMWGMVGPPRFTMYLAPLIGVGAGVMIELLVRLVGRKVRLPSLPVALAAISLMFLLFFSTRSYTGFPYHPEPTIGAPTIRALLDIKSIVPRHSAMFTPLWGFGYPLMEIGDFATYHDGGLHGGMRTTLAAKAVTSGRQEEMVSFLSYLEDFGFKSLSSTIVKEKLSPDRMMEMVFSYPGEFRGEDVYVLYLEPNIWKFDSTSYFGTWDFERKTSDLMYYVELNCFSIANDIMTCQDGKIDLKRGFMNDGAMDIPLRAALWINDGYVVSQTNYENTEGYYLQVFMKNNKINMILVADNRLFGTNFNQQYLLGNYDRRYFEEIYNNFPVARVLKVKRAER